MKQNKTKGFRKKKMTLEREIEMREAHTQLQLPKIYSKEGGKNSMKERDIKILPDLIIRGGWLKCTAGCWSIIVG